MPSDGPERFASFSLQIQVALLAASEKQMQIPFGSASAPRTVGERSYILSTGRRLKSSWQKLPRRCDDMVRMACNDETDHLHVRSIEAQGLMCGLFLVLQ